MPVKKRLVLLSAFLSPFRSGAEAMVEEVAVRIAERFDVTIVTARLSRTLPARDLLQQKVRIIRIGIGLPVDKYLFPFLAPIVCLRLRPDIIHAVLESFAGLALIFCRFIVPGARRVLTCQSTNTTFLLGPMHRSAHSVTAISSALMERARRFGRSDAIRIPNGIDLTAIRAACERYPKDSSCVLFVGRLEPMKGVDVLLKAFAQATPGLSPDIHLRIVGGGSQAEMLKNLAVSLEINHRVTFVGRRDHQAVLQEFARAEIFCGLSRSEALGNVFLEAQAAGCAVVATNVGGIPDIVKDGESGLLVTPDNVDEAVGAMRTLLTDVTLCARLSAAAKQGMASYDWGVIAARYADVLSKQ